MKKIFHYKTFYLLFLPTFITLLIFNYIPMAGIVISFQKLNFSKGIFGSPFVGLDHYRRFLSNPDFWRVFKNTLIISGYKILFVFPVPIIFAILINEIRHNKFKKVVQTFSYLPHFLSWVIVAGMLYNILSPTSGLLNALLGMFGVEPIMFMGDARYFRGVLVASEMWKSMGYSAIIYIAALVGIPSELYEAARIDGASRLRQIIHISIPSIANIICILLVLRVGRVLEEGFEQIVVLLNNSVSSVGETIRYYVYVVGLTQANNFSYATAIGFFNSFVSLFLILVTNKIVKLINEEGGLF